MAQKILVVEDEFLSRDNLCKFLGGEGYIIREASNGAEALEKIAAESCGRRLCCAAHRWTSACRIGP